MPDYKLIVGDCVEAMRAMPDCSIDAIVTDPPYGMGYHSSRRKKESRLDKIAGDDFFDHDFHVSWMIEAYRVLKNDTHIYVFINDANIENVRACLLASGFTLKRLMVWVKNSWTSGDLEGDYGHSTEFIVFAHKGRRHLNGTRVSNVINARRVNGNDLVHPTQKPTSVLVPLIEKSTDVGDTILDPFCGSGSTPVAANMLGRNAVGIDLEQKYIDAANGRLDGSMLNNLF